MTLCFKKGESPEFIADKLGRTYNAIMARLAMLRLIDDYTTPSHTPITPKSDLNMPSDCVPSGYIVDNLGKQCFVRNASGERVFSDTGIMVIIRGKIYRFKIQKICLTMKAVIFKDGQWRKSGKMLVAFSTSTLYRILSHCDLANNIEDIEEGDTIYNNKIKVRAHWFDYNGDLI